MSWFARLPIRIRLSIWYVTSTAAILGLLIFLGLAFFQRKQRADAEAEFSRQVSEMDRGFRAELSELLAGESVPRRESAPAIPSDEDLRRVAAETLQEYGSKGSYAEFRELDGDRLTLMAESRGGWKPSTHPIAAELYPRRDSSSESSRAIRLPREIGLTMRIDDAVAGKTIFVAVVGPTTSMERNLSAVRRAFILFGVAGLLVAAAGGQVLSRAALLPIDALTRRAAWLAEQRSGSFGDPLLPVENGRDEVGRLAVTLNRLLEKVDASIRVMRGFVADAAHELRTPVSVIRAEAELALSRRRDASEYEESLRAVANEAAYLSRLVSDLTLLAEGQELRAPLERVACDAGEALAEVVGALELVAGDRTVRVVRKGTSPAILDTDPGLLRRILVNLIDNAIKFSPPGSAIDVSVEGRPHEIEICVSDEAPTISPSDRSRIFERFYRTSSARTGGIPGSGLGLAIVRWAVDLHRGTIAVEPRNPSGNTFRLTLPARPPQDEKKDAATPEPPRPAAG